MNQSRFRPSSLPMRADRPLPSARTLMIVFMSIFFTVTFTVMIAGQLPVPPTTYIQPTGIVYREIAPAYQEQLRTYGWIDRSQQKVRIPITQAMKLIEERGLPTRPQP